MEEDGVDTTMFVSAISCKNGKPQSRTHLSIQEHSQKEDHV